ncbi:flagellar hook protein FliD [Alkalilimnicola ehrlichii]|uniref:Flagellar hook-associated protein 2 n=2 Tax=Alkalilimnicola ehrlichii TaxID=351052 RepID=A0A3E0X172_9GAMM|nr:flagellar hook protein FliD [Alkalilimnicola ehrlichii]RFA38415.1 flagellar hook protein FliD [Alkalilimnicola ehrlichii]
MNIDADYVREMSTQLASFAVHGQLQRLDRQEARYQTELSALQALRSALNDFNRTVTDLRSASQMVISSATFSHEDYATADIGRKATDGRYQFHVEQLASAHQLALEGLTEDDLNGGELTLTQGGESFTVDLDGGLTLQQLAAAINNHDGNPGVKASLVRNNGENILMLTSEETGEENEISLSTTGASANLAAAANDPRQLAQARDAHVYLGGEGGILLTSATNTFDNVIEDVSLTFTRTHAPGEQPLTVDIARDQEATTEQAQSFVSAFNKLMDEFDGKLASGGEDSPAGALASDAGVRAIQSQLNRIIRSQFNGQDLMSYGIMADRNGRLQIDADRFEAAIAEDPDGFDALFMGSDGMLNTINDTLRVYTNNTNGILKGRIDRVNSSLTRLDRQLEDIQRQYDTYYDRYLRQFTQMMQTMQAMQQTQGMFL